MIDATDKTSWCEGKESFDSASLARKVARLSSGRHDAAITAYRCSICHKWHTGSTSRRDRYRNQFKRKK